MLCLLLLAAIPTAYGTACLAGNGALVEPSDIVAFSPVRKFDESLGSVYMEKLVEFDATKGGVPRTGSFAAYPACTTRTSNPFLPRTGAEALPQSSRVFWKYWEAGSIDEFQWPDPATGAGTTLNALQDPTNVRQASNSHPLSNLIIQTTNPAGNVAYNYELDVPGNRYLYIAFKSQAGSVYSTLSAGAADLNAASRQFVRVSLQPANLASAQGSRCRAGGVESDDFILPVDFAFTTTNSPATPTAAGAASYTQTIQDANGANVAVVWGRVTLPTFNYYEHPAAPGDANYMHTYRHVCLHMNKAGSAANIAHVADAATTVDTNLFIAVVHSCADGYQAADLTVNFELGRAAGAAAGSVTITPTEYTCGAGAQTASRFLTVDHTPPGVVNTVALGTAAATTTGALGELLIRSSETVAGVTHVIGEAPNSEGETYNQRLARLRRTECCGSRGNLNAPGSTTANTLPKLPQLMGTCIDPSIGEGCCGVKPYDPAVEKCCNRATSALRFAGEACACTTDSAVACQRQGSNVYTVANDRTGASDALQTNWQCCQQTIYPAYSAIRQSSYCYDDVDLKCCKDGNVYDPATSQCCLVSGVQSSDLPCPCGLDSDCEGADRCCRQLFPPLFPEGEGTQCSVWSNFPKGSAGWASTNRCYGSCYDSTFQMCCNGQICNSEYERCCNTTCCNKYTSTCVEGQPNRGQGSSMNYAVYYEVCTEIESLTARRAFYVFVMPLALLISTLLALALVTLLARRLTETEFERTEQFLIVAAVIMTFLGCPFYFSPAFKYGLVVAFTGIFAILAAANRTKRLSVALVVVALVNVLFVLNPFGGNYFLGFTSNNPPARNQLVDPVTDNIVEAVNIWVRTSRHCTQFFDFFAYDDNVRDTLRLENPQRSSYGYCSRAWGTTLMAAAILVIVLALLVLLLAVFSLAKKLTKEEIIEE